LSAEQGLPLLVALHGGRYTSAYIAVAGSSGGSFLDVAGRNGFHVLTVDRPGYGDGDLPPEEENTFGRQAELLTKPSPNCCLRPLRRGRPGRTLDRRQVDVDPEVVVAKPVCISTQSPTTASGR